MILQKYQVLGNDFLIFDCINFKQNAEFLQSEDFLNFVMEKSDRRRLGCDQFIVMEKSTKADAKIVFYNSDGSKAEACGNGTEYPPCYESINGQFVYIYDAYLRDDGVLLKQTVPDAKLEHFNSTFKQLPQLNVSLTPDEFYKQAYQFLSYGKNNSCRFFVRAFDETSTNKIYFQKMDKYLQMIFYRKPMW